MRKTVNHVFLWLIIYNLLMSLVSLVPGILEAGIGWGNIIAVILGNVLIILIGCRKKWHIEDRAFEFKPMEAKNFWLLVCLLLFCQCLNIITNLITTALGAEGASIDLDISKTGFSFILYAALIGPVAEELVYRRFVIGSLEKYGKISAIIVSCIAFGLMHANLTQGIFAAITGLILGFIYVEYGLIWACIFHIINNFGLATLPGFLIGDSKVAEYIYGGLIIAGGITGIILLIRRRAEVKEWLSQPELRGEHGFAKAVLTSVWFWVFCLMFIFIIVMFIMNPQMTDVISASLNAA